MRFRRSTSVKPKILVDTTFILPALGIEVEEEAMSIIPLFRKFNIYYLEVSILEAMWKIIKLVPTDKLNRVRMGLHAIRSTYYLLKPSPEAYMDAITIYREGHRDYIDALHYTSAKTEGMPLLTIDYEFIDFLKGHGYQVDGIINTPKDLSKLVSKT